MTLAAVTQNGEALRYSSEELRRDKEVVLLAVRQAAVERDMYIYYNCYWGIKKLF